VNLDGIARLVGVSMTTASYALSGTGTAISVIGPRIDGAGVAADGRDLLHLAGFAESHRLFESVEFPEELVIRRSAGPAPGRAPSCLQTRPATSPRDGDLHQGGFYGRARVVPERRTRWTQR